MKKFLLILGVVLLLPGCSSKEVTVSHTERVIKAMMTCPNEELYDPEMTYNLGEGVELSEEKKAKIKAASDRVYSNWENTVGNCFSENNLKVFLGSGSAFSYLIKAEDTGEEISVKSIEVKEKTETSEKDLVILMVGNEEQKVEVDFRYDTDGLIWSVAVTEE